MKTMVVAPNKLRDARENAGLSQRDASAHLDVTERSLRAWEKGEARITADHAASLARLYGVADLWSLFIHEQDADTPSAAGEESTPTNHEPGAASDSSGARLAHTGG